MKVSEDTVVPLLNTDVIRTLIWNSVKAIIGNKMLKTLKTETFPFHYRLFASSFSLTRIFKHIKLFSASLWGRS